MPITYTYNDLGTRDIIFVPPFTSKHARTHLKAKLMETLDRPVDGLDSPAHSYYINKNYVGYMGKTSSSSPSYFIEEKNLGRRAFTYIEYIDGFKPFTGYANIGQVISEKL